MKEKIQALLRAVWPYTIALFIGFVTCRLYEFFSLTAEVRGSFGWCVQGFGIDLLVAFFVTGVYCLLQLFLFLFRLPQWLGLLYSLSLIALIVNFILVQYFLTTGVPLDEAIYFFSWAELKLIVGTENRLTVAMVLFFAGIITVHAGLLFFLRKYKTVKWFAYSWGIAMLISILFPSLTYLGSSGSHQQAIIVNNRISYFLHRSAFYFRHGLKEGNMTVSARSFRGLDPNFYGGKPVSETYPLLHDLPEESELANFLNKSEKGAPNIVFIIVESLSTTLVGEKADKTGHLLPFLDSLSRQSLYWPNFLSTCDRTHNVLPAALASVPYTPKGKQFQEIEFPQHWSLMSLLNKNYFTRFFCGVDLSFSNMRGFMNFYRPDYIVRDWEPRFSEKFTERDNPWGFPDGALFAKSWLDYKKQKLEAQKRLDVLLTISTHDPFVIPREQYYTDLVLKRIAKLPRQSAEYSNVSANASRFATFIYFDDQLKAYFKQAQQSPDFDNTIFLIFGDHGTQFCMYDKLSAYKIPLLIYSPLLKKPEVFRSVSSQLDIAPTLLNYLRLTYDMELPSTVSFLGHTLSFRKEFESNRSLLFGTAGLNDGHLIHKNHYLFHDELFRVGDELEITPSADLKTKRMMIAQRNLCNLMAEYTIFGNKILPPALSKSFVAAEEFVQLLEKRQPKPDKTALQAVYISIGEDLVLPQVTEYVRIEFSCDYWNLGTKFADLPPLTLSIDHTVDGKVQNLCWKQAAYQPIGNWKKNAWNKLSATVTIRLSDYEKMASAGLLKYYLLNTEGHYFCAKNLQTRVLKNASR